jgi:hypothetical protein
VTRQHATPLLIDADGAAIRLVQVPLGGGADQMSEGELQTFLQLHPTCLPISEIDPIFAEPVPICMELNTPVGSIDNFMVTPSGLPVLVECKLWRNPQGRREVVGQILDYAKELSRWSSSDVQREVSRRLARPGNPLLELIRDAGHEVDEIEFNDALTFNLRRGRFLLLIVGDGIREAVEAIAEYLQTHAGLHFTLGLVEIPIYSMPGGTRLIAPRIVAKTQLITRTVIAAPDGMSVSDSINDSDVSAEDTDTLSRISFWREFVAGLKLDDPEQQKPRPGQQGYVSLSLPVPGGTAWITIFRNIADWRVGLFLSYTRESLGERVVRRVIEDWSEIQRELSGTVRLYQDKLGRSLIQDERQTGPWVDTSERSVAMAWLRLRTNDFVNVLRPRVRTALADISQEV